MADLNSVFPAKLVEKRFISTVPDSVYRETKDSRAKEVSKSNRIMGLLVKKVMEIQDKSAAHISPLLSRAQGVKAKQKNSQETQELPAVLQQSNKLRRPLVKRPAREFNAAAWLRLDNVPDKPISLLVVYTDGQGEFAVIADECSASENGHIMLSGKVTIESYGDIQQMSVYCAGLVEKTNIVVDELYVQNVPEKSVKAKDDEKVAPQPRRNEVRRYLAS